MIKLYDGGAWLIDGKEVLPDSPQAGEIIQNKYGKKAPEKKEAAKNTIAYSILKDHNTSGNMEELKIKFDKLTSHDITFRRDHSDSQSFRTGEIPYPLRTDQLP